MSERNGVDVNRLVGRLVPIKGVPDDVTELHPMMHGGNKDFIWAWVPDKSMAGNICEKKTYDAHSNHPRGYYRPPTWADDKIKPIRIFVGARSKKPRWFWVYSPNHEVRDAGRRYPSRAR